MITDKEVSYETDGSRRRKSNSEWSFKACAWQKLGVLEVQAAENGEKALELAETFHPDIVLSDIRMPGMSGIELCRTLREKYPEIEIIFPLAMQIKNI